MYRPDKNQARLNAQRWAISIVNNPDVLYLDLETNGLPDQETGIVDIVQICFINQERTTVFNSIVSTPKPMERKVEKMINLTWRELHNTNLTFKDIAPIIDKVIKNKHLVAYNSVFDITQINLNLKKLGFTPYFSYDCAMLKYAEYCGIWNSKKEDWKWLSLPKIGGDAHNAEGDTRSLYDLIRIMAEGGMVGDDLDIDLDF